MDRLFQAGLLQQFVDQPDTEFLFWMRHTEVAGLGGMVWMSIGAFIMAKMVSFEI